MMYVPHILSQEGVTTMRDEHSAQQLHYKLIQAVFHGVL